MIRIMTPDDYDAVHACWMACTCMGLNTIDDSREGIIRYLERNPNTCFVDEQEGTITGAILAGHDGRRGYIYHTAVTPAYRHQGIGTALVNAALHALANEGIIKVAPSSPSHATMQATMQATPFESASASLRAAI